MSSQIPPAPEESNVAQVKEERITSTGTWTWPGDIDWVEVTVVSGGGGGGGNTGSAGGGGAVIRRNVPVTGNVAVTIGAGGNAGTPSAAATNGGTSLWGAPIAVQPVATTTQVVVFGGGRGGNGFVPPSLTFPSISSAAGGTGGGSNSTIAPFTQQGTGGGAGNLSYLHERFPGPGSLPSVSRGIFGSAGLLNSRQPDPTITATHFGFNGSPGVEGLGGGGGVNNNLTAGIGIDGGGSRRPAPFGGEVAAVANTGGGGADLQNGASGVVIVRWQE